jgi:sugar phosphate isomerase/epimerase
MRSNGPAMTDTASPDNPLGIHALVWTGSWDRASVERACQQTRGSGFDLLEVPLLDPKTVDAAMTREILQASSLDATCSLGLSFDTDISSTDTPTVERGRQLLGHALDVADRIGSRYLGGVLYSALDKYHEPPTIRGRANAVAVLRDLAADAASRDIVLGIEPVNRYESNLINTVDQALDLIDAIGSPQIVVHLDAYHAHIEEPDLDDARPARPRCRTARLRPPRREPPRCARDRADRPAGAVPRARRGRLSRAAGLRELLLRGRFHLVRWRPRDLA